MSHINHSHSVTCQYSHSLPYTSPPRHPSSTHCPPRSNIDQSLCSTCHDPLSNQILPRVNFLANFTLSPQNFQNFHFGPKTSRNYILAPIFFKNLHFDPKISNKITFRSKIFQKLYFCPNFKNYILTLKNFSEIPF